jgi:NodT family efflux transporter outer membrane factor (OMF) lipoprotein
MAVHSSHRPSLWALVACGAGLGLVGCATPTAPQLRPVTLSAQFANAAVDGTAARTHREGDTPWWRGFGDPTLSALIDRGLQANHDLRSALARVQAARAGVDMQAARLAPAVNAQAGSSRSATGLPLETKESGQPDVRVLQGGVAASWEIDLAGGMRAAVGAARAEAVAAEAQAAAAKLLVAGDIAQLYFTLRSAQERLGIVQALAEAQRATASAVARRAAQGQASAFDLQRAQAEAESVQAQVPPLQTLLAVTRSRLAVLVGEDPSAWPDMADPSYSWPAPRDIGIGQPADLLRRRPDLMAAESRWEAESLRSAEARAQTWPKLFVSALAGRQDLRINAVDLATARFTHVAAAFAMPFFDAGRIQAGIAAQAARETEAQLAWQKAILVAVEDVENSLAQRRDTARRVALLEAAATARRQSVRHAQSLYREGQGDIPSLLDVQRLLLSSELALVEAQMQRTHADVQLFKALGGGWKSPCVPASAQSTQRNTATATATATAAATATATSRTQP